METERDEMYEVFEHLAEEKPLLQVQLNARFLQKSPDVIVLIDV